MVCPAPQDHLRFHILWLFLLSHKHYILYQASNFPLVSQCSERFCLKLFRGCVEMKCYMLFYPQSIPENRERKANNCSGIEKGKICSEFRENVHTKTSGFQWQEMCSGSFLFLRGFLFESLHVLLLKRTSYDGNR